MASKKAHEEQLRKGLALLRENGISVDGAQAETVARLMEQVGGDASKNLAVVFLLGRHGDASAAESLLTIDRNSDDKNLKKEIKRALFKLEQKGVAVPKREAPMISPAATLLNQGPAIEAYMSAVDGGGGRLIWLAKPQPKQGLQVIQAMLHDREGLLRIGGVHMRRKELRRMAEEIKQQHGVSMIAIPWRFADQMIYQGFEKAKARGQTGLENFHEIRSVVATGKPQPVKHPIYEKLREQDFREGAWREASRRLLEEPELRYWVVIDEWLQECLEALDEVRSSRLILNQVQKEERLAAVVRDAVKRLCSGANGEAFKQRMEDMALYFYETQRVDQAKLALAVAQQVGEGDPGPLDIAFLTGLMQKSFALIMSQQKAQAEEQKESSLIIKP